MSRVAAQFIDQKFHDSLREDYVHYYEQFQDRSLILCLSTLHAQIAGSLRNVCDACLNYEPTSPHRDKHEQGPRLNAEFSRTFLDCYDTVQDFLANCSEVKDLAINLTPTIADLLQRIYPHVQRTGGSYLPADLNLSQIPAEPFFVSKKVISLNRGGLNVNLSANLSKLGQGGYGTVYKFHDDFLDCDFCVKELLPGTSDKDLERFRREYELLQKLRSPYIITVYSYIEHFGGRNEPAFVMECMDGSLQKLINNEKDLSLERRLTLAEQAIKAVEYLHGQGVLHRDISPQNFLYRRYQGGFYELRISDFGLIKAPLSELTSENSLPRGWFNDYSTLSSKGFDAFNVADDLYALTKLIGFIISGKTEPPQMKACHSALEAFVERGISPTRPDNRYQTISEFKQAFSELSDALIIDRQK
ncbi:MAG: serine/threonine protein kinase [Succinivibrio sp.]|nr:serine/threonine protein kinase [Succinivibrio sp.]